MWFCCSIHSIYSMSVQLLCTPSDFLILSAAKELSQGILHFLIEDLKVRRVLHTIQMVKPPRQTVICDIGLYKNIRLDLWSNTKTKCQSLTPFATNFRTQLCLILILSVAQLLLNERNLWNVTIAYKETLIMAPKFKFPVLHTAISTSEDLSKTSVA